MRCSLTRLHLLCAPSSICFPHVLRWLDGGNEFEDYVCDPYDTNHRPKDYERETITKENRSGEDVDYTLSVSSLCCANVQGNIQTPRPMKENKKEAYREICGGIWNSAMDNQFG